MTLHRRNQLSILALVASDSTYYEKGKLKERTDFEAGSLLRSLPDNSFDNEYGFPQPLWLSLPETSEPYLRHKVFVGEPTPAAVSETRC